MSQAVQQFVLEHEPLDGGDDWEEKTFQDHGNFWSTVELLKGKGLDYEYETPPDYDVPGEKEEDEKSDADSDEDESEAADEDSDSLDAEVVDMTEEAKTDGSGEEVVETEVVENGHSEQDVAADVPEEPPERDLSDDPIEWINRTAGDFVDNIQGTQAINKKGFRVLQYWYDINTDSEVVVGPEETDFEYCRVRATAEMPDGQTAVAHGSAHVGRGDDMELLLEMADTRAKSRALSDITGVGAVAISELKSGEK